MRASAVPTVEPFTWAAYAAYLDLALANGYSFESFALLQQPRPWPEHRFILLRHDIDYDPQATLPISQLEAERGIRATWFFQIRSPYYRLADAAAHQALTAVLSAGHWLGLHYDATEVASDTQVLDEVEQQAVWLERRYQTTIAAVSFHMPTRRPVKHLNLHNGRLNTYAPVFFERLEYVSDSNQDWRGKSLARVVGEQRPHALQILTHPIWWRPRYVPFVVTLQELAARLNLDLDQDILTPEQRLLLEQAEKRK